MVIGTFSVHRPLVVSMSGLVDIKVQDARSKTIGRTWVKGLGCNSYW